MGTYGIDRRCLTVPEMTAKGMGSNKDGFWMTKIRPLESIPTSPSDATAADLVSTQPTPYAQTF